MFVTKMLISNVLYICILKNKKKVFMSIILVTSTHKKKIWNKCKMINPQIFPTHSWKNIFTSKMICKMLMQNYCTTFFYMFRGKLLHQMISKNICKIKITPGYLYCKEMYQILFWKIRAKLNTRLPLLKSNVAYCGKFGLVIHII